MFGWLTERRRRHLLEAPLPAPWRDVLHADVALAGRLSAEERARWHDLTHVFLAEKTFEGAGGLVLEDHHRVVIAGVACLLLVGLGDHDLYAEVETILVYPGAVVAPGGEAAATRPGEVVASPTPIYGQAFRRGPVILAWDRALAGARGEVRGNVVLHEFAHKIDMHDGPTDGTPPLPARAGRAAWAAAFAPAFLDHRAAVEAGRRTFLGAYAATNEAEFFAVATEAYFTRGRALAEALPEVFAALRAFYRVDLSDDPSAPARPPDDGDGDPA